MERRTLLGAVGSVLAAASVAGCGGDSTSPSKETDPSTDPEGDGGEPADDEPTADTTNADERFEPRFGTAGSDTPTGAYESYVGRFPQGREQIAETVHPNSTLDREFFLDNWHLEQVDSADATAQLVQENPSYGDIESFSEFLGQEYSIRSGVLQPVYEFISEQNQTALVSASITVEIDGEQGEDLERFYENPIHYAIVATHEESWFLVDVLTYSPQYD